MHEKPVKLDMSFDEALLRLSKTPKNSIKIDSDQEKNIEKIKLKAAVEQQIKAAPFKKRVRPKTI